MVYVGKACTVGRALASRKWLNSQRWCYIREYVSTHISFSLRAVTSVAESETVICMIALHWLFRCIMYDKLKLHFDYTMFTPVCPMQYTRPTLNHFYFVRVQVLRVIIGNRSTWRFSVLSKYTRLPGVNLVVIPLLDYFLLFPTFLVITSNINALLSAHFSFRELP